MENRTQTPTTPAPERPACAATLQITNLCTGYKSKHRETPVGRELNGTLFAGELTCLIGANGSGKSTLLNTLCRFLPALGGSISVLGRDLTAYTPRQLAHTLAVVLTEHGAPENMDVYSMVAMGRSPYTGFWGKLTSQDEQLIANVLQDVGIAAFAHRLVHTLSDGERQKVMIAKALSQQTPIILLDEPMAFLDFPGKVETMKLLQKIARTTHKTIFLSTHDLEIALQLADKLWLLDKQKGLRVGTPEDLAQDGTLDGFFAGEGVRFDPRSGLFAVSNQCTRTIALSGSSPRAALLTKALARNGVAVAPAPNSPSAYPYLQVPDDAHLPIVLYSSPQTPPTSAPTISRMVQEVLSLPA